MLLSCVHRGRQNYVSFVFVQDICSRYSQLWTLLFICCNWIYIKWIYRIGNVNDVKRESENNANRAQFYNNKTKNFRLRLSYKVGNKKDEREKSLLSINWSIPGTSITLCSWLFSFSHLLQKSKMYWKGISPVCLKS